MNKNTWLIIGILALLTLAVLLYRFYIIEPTALPSDERLLEEMLAIHPESKAIKIQERFYIDDRHAIVPYLSTSDQYGLSYWVFKGTEWKLAVIDTNGDPKVWRIEEQDPSTYYFAWNINPKDEISSFELYLVRERDYQGTTDRTIYSPRIEMKEKIALGQTSYGFLKIPSNWSAALTHKVKLEESNSFVFNPQQLFNVQFGWIGYNENNQEVFPNHTINNGSTFINGDERIDFILVTEKYYLEER